jgi:hypothetical protein
MHKKPGAGKKTGARIDPAAAPRRLPAGAVRTRVRGGGDVHHGPHSVNNLLAGSSKLRQVVHAIPEQQAWGEWLRERLPAELAPHLVNAVPRGAAGGPRELVLLADSAVWCARLRYALEPLDAEIRARDVTIARISVRVGR